MLYLLDLPDSAETAIVTKLRSYHTVGPFLAFQVIQPIDTAIFFRDTLSIPNSNTHAMYFALNTTCNLPQPTR